MLKLIIANVEILQRIQRRQNISNRIFCKIFYQNQKFIRDVLKTATTNRARSKRQGTENSYRTILSIKHLHPILLLILALVN